ASGDGDLRGGLSEEAAPGRAEGREGARRRTRRTARPRRGDRRRDQDRARADGDGPPWDRPPGRRAERRAARRERRPRGGTAADGGKRSAWTAARTDGVGVVKARKVKGLDPEGPLAENARRIIDVRAREVHSFVPAVFDPQNVEALHDMRIASKRLRYVLELTTPVFGEPAAKG